jgi:hypothetical protein
VVAEPAETLESGHDGLLNGILGLGRVSKPVPGEA